MLKSLRNVGTINLEESRSADEGSSQNTETLKLIHVEDDQTVATLIQEIADHEGWQLKHFAETGAALRELASDVHYDVLLVDYESPRLDGLELVRQARSMVHRADLRIVMMSGTLEEAAARDAGADVFLRKPQGIQSLVETMSRLLAERGSDG